MARDSGHGHRDLEPKNRKNAAHKVTKDSSRDQNDGHLSGPFILFIVKLCIKSIEKMISYQLFFVA